MLLVRKHWHDASKRNPHREARLLWFSTGGTPAAGEGANAGEPEKTLAEMTGSELLTLLREARNQQKTDEQTLKEIGALITRLEKRINKQVEAGDMDAASLLGENEQDFVNNLLQTDLVREQEAPLLRSERISDFHPEIQDTRERIQEVMENKVKAMTTECREEGKKKEHETPEAAVVAYAATKKPEEQRVIQRNADAFLRAATEGKIEFLKGKLKPFVESYLEKQTGEQIVTDFANSLQPGEKAVVENNRATFEKTAAEIVTEAFSNVSVEVQDKPLRPNEIASGFETMVKHFDAIRQYRQDHRLTKTIDALPPDERSAAYDALHLVESQHAVASELHDAALRLAEWKDGKLTPKAFRASLERSFASHPRLPFILSAFDTEAQNPAIAHIVKKWNEDGNIEQESDKQLVVQQIWTAIEGEILISELQAYLDEWTKHVTKVEELIKPEEKGQEGNPKAQNLSLMERIIDIRRNGIAGIGFYSPLEWYEATKKVYQAFKDARQEHLDQVSNAIGVNLAFALEKLHVPYGESVNRRFGSNAEADFNKKKNEYKEELGDDSFEVLEGKFHQVRRDPPRAIAVLEVAAGNGWLYEISDLSDEAWPVYIFGEEFSSLTPSHWDENQIKNYFGTLTRQNTEGGKSQRKKGHDRMETQQDPEVYLKKFEGMLEAHDYWQAMGIGEALIERGKMQEASEVLTAKFIQHLRNRPNAAKYMNKTVLEQFAIMKWNQGLTFSQNMIAMNMGALQKLRADGTTMEGSLLSTLQLLEAEVKAASGGTLKGMELAKVVGKILSGKTETINGHVISIYQEKYRDYWDETKNSVFGTYKGDAFAKNIATDYYSDASLLQLPSIAVESIYTTGSTGQLSNQELAQNFAGFSISRLAELQKSDPEAARVFQGYMREKFRKGLEIALTGQAPKQLYKYKWKQGNAEGQWMVASLIYWGFVSKEEVFRFAKGHQGEEEFRMQIQRQLREVAAAPLKMKENSPPAAPPGAVGP